MKTLLCGLLVMASVHASGSECFTLGYNKICGEVNGSLISMPKADRKPFKPTFKNADMICQGFGFRSAVTMESRKGANGRIIKIFTDGSGNHLFLAQGGGNGRFRIISSITCK